MQSLHKNWITESHIDFEYKKYIMLAYLHQVSENFTEHRLYPYLSDLIEHYRNLKALKENKKQLFDMFPEKLTGASLEQFRMIYEKLTTDDTVMQEIENIINFSMPQMEFYLKEGKSTYDFIEENIRVFPVGLIPLNNDAGYVFLKSGGSNQTMVYDFQMTIFENPVEKFRGIHMAYVTPYEKSLLNTFESIKADLLKYNKNLPNPAAFVVETDLQLPFEETFLPLAKRSIVKHISASA
ncbi:MAG: hypothetical protein IT242_11330 [Bacteroidia bacterium]|nr:hypothetical protein [Bacteroidia bacterium]